MKLTHKKKPSLEKGVHLSDVGVKKGPSYVGHLVREGAPKRHIVEEHEEALREIRSNPKPHGEYAEGGSVCPTCGGTNCYAHGGSVATKEDAANIRGVHPAVHGGKSVAHAMGEAGGNTAYSKYAKEGEKNIHKMHLDELRSMPKPHGEYAHGGKVSERDLEKEHDRKGRELIERLAKKIPFTPVEEKEPVPRGSMMNMTKTRAPFAEGGEVEDGQVEEIDTLENMDDEIQGILGQELMESFEKKDHKGVMKSIEAIIRTCLSKE